MKNNILGMYSLKKKHKKNTALKLLIALLVSVTVLIAGIAVTTYTLFKKIR